MKFEFEDQNSKLIPLDYLRQSATLSETTGRMPKTRPVEHYELIDRVVDVLNNERVLTDTPQIWVSKAGNNPIKRFRQAEPDFELENWLFQRLVAKIPLTNYRNDEFNGSIAIGYNESGIQLAWGTDVRVCQNMSIFGHMFMSTYGKDGIKDINKFFDIIRVWSKHAALKNEFDLMVFRTLKERRVDWTEIPSMLGWLSLAAIKDAYMQGETAPLNIGQHSEICKRVLKAHLTENEAETSAFEIYNMGTNILSPQGTSDLSTIWEKNLIWGMFILQHFMLENITKDAKFEILNTI